MPAARRSVSVARNKLNAEVDHRVRASFRFTAGGTSEVSIIFPNVCAGSALLTM